MTIVESTNVSASINTEFLRRTGTHFVCRKDGPSSCPCLTDGLKDPATTSLEHIVAASLRSTESLWWQNI